MSDRCRGLSYQGLYYSVCVTRSSCILNIIVAGALARQGARTSTVMVLSKIFRNIPISAPAGKHTEVHTKWRSIYEDFSLSTLCVDLIHQKTTFKNSQKTRTTIRCRVNVVVHGIKHSMRSDRYLYLRLL